MAKALLGHVHSDPRTSAVLVSENARLRRRVTDLEDLVVALSADNDRLVAERAERLLGREDETIQEMQPA
jgi:cell division protein FtsB